MQLLDASYFVLQTTATDSNGDYIFENVEPGLTYYVAVIPPNTSTTFTTSGPDMDFDPTTGITVNTITPGNGENVVDIDAGLCSLLSLGNLVFNDANSNGQYDTGEGIFAGVDVYLIDGTDGTTYLDTTATDANGRYVFTALQAGDYIVEVDVPAGYQSTTDIASTPTPNQADGDDNGPGAANTGRVRSNAITLAADGGNPADANWGEADHGVLIGGQKDPTPDGKAYYTVDFGFRLIPANPIFDLALRKTVASQSDTPLIPGTSTVTFNLRIFNQGDIAADSIEITDYIPAGLTLADGAWTDTGATATRLLSVTNGGLTAALAVGDSTDVTITLSVDAGVEGIITNYAEISRATDDAGNPVTDIDSTPNGINDETAIINDEVNDDGTIDEDDHDLECISVPVELCEGQTVTLEAPAGTSHQWYKGTTELTGETNPTLIIAFDASGNFEGDYYVIMGGDATLGGCGSQNCCPVTLVTGTCPPDCPTDRCIPGTMMKVSP